MASSPPNSRRAKIKNNLVRQLATITVANGYSRTVNYVDFNVLTYNQLGASETPAICVVPDLAKIDYKAGSLIEIDWKFFLYITMKETTALDMDEFISDIEVCCAANATLNFNDTGMVASYIRIRDIATDGGFFLKDQTAIAKLTVSVVFTKRYGER